MSETPRTQQLIDIANDEGISDAAVALVLQEHSEQLEREIAEANIEIEGLEEEIVALCDRLKRVNGGELGKQLAEARARIDILERAYNDLIEEQAAICAEGQSIAELVAAKDKQLAEARAEIESKNRLVEQMREALGDAFDHICPNGDPLDARELEVCNKIEAALAAEGCE